MSLPLTSPGRTSQDAAAYLPRKANASLAQHRLAAEKCRGCDLYKNATQVVFGEGKTNAEIMLIGEQPGDQEDRQGRPFVGPAGKLLDSALQESGIDRSAVYITNAVKHFKWKPAPRGKRRLHSKPSAREIHACRPWLQREIFLIKPKIIISLGATAGQTLFGAQFRITSFRGKIIRDSEWAPNIIVTVHPSAILRIPDPQDKEREFKAFAADLRLAREILHTS